MEPIKLVTVVGARPQFIKAAAVTAAVARWNRTGEGPFFDERLIHTGQHYDHGLSQVFFDELGVREPDHHLGIGSGSQGDQTGRMLIAIEAVLIEHRPDIVLLYGDTNSTLAGGLAAAKLHIPVAHVEAGLRSYNRLMAEELNRVVTDHLATWCFCPSETAVRNLEHESIRDGVHLVGDVMFDVMRMHLSRARERTTYLNELGLKPGGFALATVHRAENTDSPERLAAIVAGLETVAGALPVVLPLHPRTQAACREQRLNWDRVQTIEPVSYQEMLLLLDGARVVLTDSGGLQKEAYWMETPCVTLRDETEWLETVEAGWNVLVGADVDQIRAAVSRSQVPQDRTQLYGDGRAAEAIVRLLGDDTANIGQGRRPH